MNRTKRLKGPCSHCEASFEFPAEMVGTTSACPFCGKVTELMLATPPQEPAIPTRVIVWTVIAAIILLGGLAASLFALKKTQGLMLELKAPASESPASR